MASEAEFDNLVAAAASGRFYSDGVNIQDSVSSDLIQLLERTGRICVVAECASADGPDAPQIGTWTMWNLSAESGHLFITKPEYATGLLEDVDDAGVNNFYLDVARHLESLQGTYHLNDDGSGDLVEHELQSSEGIRGLRRCSKLTIYVIGHSIKEDPIFYVNEEEGVEIANVFAESVNPDFRPIHIKRLSGTVPGEHSDVYVIEYDQVVTPSTGWKGVDAVVAARTGGAPAAGKAMTELTRKKAPFSHVVL